MVRSILAVLVGYLTFGVSAFLLFQLSGQDPQVVPELRFFVFSILYGIGFAMLAGYLAASIARSVEVRHAAAVAAILGLLSSLSIILKLTAPQPEWSAGIGAIWSDLSVLLLMAPAAVVGGYLRQRRGKLERQGESGI